MASKTKRKAAHRTSRLPQTAASTFEISADLQQQEVVIALMKGKKLVGTCYLTPDVAAKMVRTLSAMRDEVLDAAASSDC